MNFVPKHSEGKTIYDYQRHDLRELYIKDMGEYSEDEDAWIILDKKNGARVMYRETHTPRDEVYEIAATTNRAWVVFDETYETGFHYGASSRNPLDGAAGSLRAVVHKEFYDGGWHGRIVVVAASKPSYSDDVDGKIYRIDWDYIGCGMEKPHRTFLSEDQTQLISMFRKGGGNFTVVHKK